MSITTDKFVSALINTFRYDKYVNLEKKNKIFMFSPHRFKPVVKDVILQLCLSLFVFIFFPFFPFVRKLKNICFSMNGRDEMIVVSSEKSFKLFEGNGYSKNAYNVIYTSGQSGDSYGFKLCLASYYAYICTCIDFFKCFKLSIWFYPAVLHIPKMMSFSSFVEISRPKKIIFTNHYDRWTLLVLSYCEKFNAESVLIQHGILDDSLDFSALKYKRLNKIFCYNKSQYDIFVKYFYEQIDTFHFFKPTIKIAPIKHSSKSILIVGHGDPSVVNSENHAINWLLFNTDFIIYIKPHPVFKNNAHLYIIDNSERCFLINDSAFYPDVDYLLHSGSTLAEEYQNCSSKVKVHNLNDFKQSLSNG